MIRTLRGKLKTNTLSKKEIARVAKNNGAKLVSCKAISAMRTHCYALLEKI
jgi:histone H3/H4